MKAMLQFKIVRLLTWFLARLAPEPKVYEQSLETVMRSLNALYGTSGVHTYLDGREAYLKQMLVDAVMEHKDVQADKTAGGLYELRLFRDKLKAAHVWCEKIKRETLNERKQV